MELKKGSTGWMISQWDSKGTFTYRPVMVESAGKKQATMSTNNKMHERAYYANRDGSGWATLEARLFGTKEAAAVGGWLAANAWIEQEIATYRRILESGYGKDSPGYVIAITNNLAEMLNATASCVSYDEAHAAMVAKLQARLDEIKG